MWSGRSGSSDLTLNSFVKDVITDEASSREIFHQDIQFLFFFSKKKLLCAMQESLSVCGKGFVGSC